MMPTLLFDRSSFQAGCPTLGSRGELWPVTGQVGEQQQEEGKLELQEEEEQEEQEGQGEEEQEGKEQMREEEKRHKEEGKEKMETSRK